MIRAVCFDLYETLVTEAGVPKPSKDRWAAQWLGLPSAQVLEVALRDGRGVP
jgi:FMN phosphatase YigB (HAD superfamily)